MLRYWYFHISANDGAKTYLRREAVNGSRSFKRYSKTYIRRGSDHSYGTSLVFNVLTDTSRLTTGEKLISFFHQLILRFDKYYMYVIYIRIYMYICFGNGWVET